MLAFYAARGYNKEDLDKAVRWTPAERMFFETARSIYWEDMFRMIMLASDNVVRTNIIDEDHRFQNRYEDEFQSFVKNHI